MRGNIREQLNTELSRKQFVQYLSAALLAAFGVGNVLGLLLGSKQGHTTIVIGGNSNGSHGFGSSRFGD
jgi:hypothetical protein